MIIYESFIHVLKGNIDENRLCLRFKRVQHNHLVQMKGSLYNTSIPILKEDTISTLNNSPKRPDWRSFIQFEQLYGLSFHNFFQHCTPQIESGHFNGVFFLGTRPACIFNGKRNELRVHSFSLDGPIPFLTPHTIFNHSTDSSYHGISYMTENGTLRMGKLDDSVDYDFHLPMSRSLLNIAFPYKVKQEQLESEENLEDHFINIPRVPKKIVFHSPSIKYCLITEVETPFFINPADE